MHCAECYVEDTLVESDGKMVPGISLTCGLCDKTVEVSGRDSSEVRAKALRLLREGCKDRHLKHVILKDTME